MKHELLQRISKIHAIKCWKAAETDLAIESFDTLGVLKEQVIACEDENEWSNIKQKIDDWAGNNPIATDREINELLKH